MGQEPAGTYIFGSNPMNQHQWGDSPINLLDAVIAYGGKHDQIIAWDYLQANTPSSVLKQFADLHGSLLPEDVDWSRDLRWAS